MTKAPNNTNNLHRIQTSSLVQRFLSHRGSFDQFKLLTFLTTARQTLTSSLRVSLGSSLAKLVQIFKEAGSELNKDQITTETDSRAGFSLACGKGESLIPYLLLRPRWSGGLCHQSLRALIFG